MVIDHHLIPAGILLLPFRLALLFCQKSAVRYELGNPSLHLGPRQFHFYGASGAGEQQLCAVPAAIFAGQPGSGIFLSCMICHIVDHRTFAGNVPIPSADGIVDVILRKRAQQLVETRIGLVNDFSVQALAELRRIGIELEQLPVAGRQNSAADGRSAFNHGTFIIAVTTGVAVSGVLGNGLQNDGLIFLMQLSEGRLYRLRLIVASFWLRLLLGKKRSRGRFHTLCFINFLDLFRFGEEQV